MTRAANWYGASANQMRHKQLLTYHNIGQISIQGTPCSVSRVRQLCWPGVWRRGIAALVSRDDWDNELGGRAMDANQQGKLLAYRGCIFLIAQLYCPDPAAQPALAADALCAPRSCAF